MKKFFSLLIFLMIFGLSAPTEAKKLQFVQISDTDISLEQYKNKDAKNTAYYLKKAIKEINKNRDIDFVIFTGGNIDAPDRKTLVNFYKKSANKLNKPYFVVLGDKEVLRSKHFNKKNYIRATWLHHLPMMFKGTNYVFKPNNELVFIVVDGTNELFPSTSGYFKKETLEWLDKKLYKYKNKKIVIVQHYPLIPPRKKFSYETINADEYFHILNSHDNIIAILSGHYSTDKTIYKKGIYHISAPAFSNYPNTYKIITIEYTPKYLFSNPAEFNITQELKAVGEPEETLEENTNLIPEETTEFIEEQYNE